MEKKKYVGSADPYKIDENAHYNSPNLEKLFSTALLEEPMNFQPSLLEPKKNYKIIKDEKELQRFINWLPELRENEKFYYSLFARKKYGATEGLKADKAQLKRGTATKKDLVNKLKKLEVEVGSYTIDGIPINQDSLVVYITPNPRDMHKAGLSLLKTLAHLLAMEQPLSNPHSLALNAIQITPRKLFIDIDIDFTDNWQPEKKFTEEIVFPSIKEYVNENALTWIRTKGGFHVLVELNKIEEKYKPNWYMNIQKIKSEYFNVMMNGDNMIPIPGCTQSDFTPYLV